MIGFIRVGIYEMGKGVAAAAIAAVVAILPARARPLPLPSQLPTAVSDAEIAQLIRFRVEKQHGGSGIVVGVLRPSGSSLIAFGTTALNGRRKMDGATIFEIASLSKVFTALLLADAAERGEARPEDPLSAYVPSGVGVPQYDGHPIKLADLATHGSGFPLRPINLNAPPDAINKYASFTLEELYAGLPSYKLTRPPGSKFEYSNVGFGLLGQGLALRAHITFSDLLRARITGPLAMKDTGLGDSVIKAVQRAQGYDIDLKPVPPSDDGALNPAGGLRSTANDLMRFLNLFLIGKGPGELPAAARFMLTFDGPGQQEDTRMALGWRRTSGEGETFYWSDGSGDGSRTFMGFNPRRRIAVVVLANASSGYGVDDIGAHVIAPAQVVNLKILKIHQEISLPPAALEGFIGTYQFAHGDQIVVTRGAGGLLVGSGPSQFSIYPETQDQFFAKVADLQLAFQNTAGSKFASAVVLHQDGQNSVYTRVP
jgi:D-alanyl-D-alanine-carboxypeptidase/D-alanyl-D-alanine-endopeptidase